MTLKDFALRWERWIVGIIMAAVLGTGYYGLDLYLARTPLFHAHEIMMPLDQRVPLVPWTIWIYSLYYIFCFLVIPLLTSRERFFRVALAFFAEFALAFMFFVFYPTRIIRPEVLTPGVSSDLLRWFYGIDPGYNIFPSLHVANSILVAWCFFSFGSRYAWPVLITALLISGSTVLVKAHYVLDIPAGIILALVSVGLAWGVVREKETDENRAAVSPGMSTVLLFLGLAGVLGTPGTAGANPFDHYGLGSRGGAMSNANVAVADDWTAPYYNPAGMTLGGETFGFGIMGVASTYVRIRPMGTGQPTDSFEEVRGFFLGITHPLGTENLRAGLTVYLPLQRYQMNRSYFIDEKEALPGMSNQLHFEFYGEPEQGQVLLPALAYRFADWLRLGIGVTILNNTTAMTTVYEPDLTNASTAYININNDTIYTYAPIGGITSVLPGNFTLGASYRGEIAFPIHGPTTINGYYPGIGPIPKPLTLYLDFLVSYTPAMASIGVSYTGVTGVLLTGELGWAGWSHYKDTHNDYPSPRLNDVITPRIGVESHFDPWVLRGGYSYENSPVPHQSGRTNIVDNDSHILTFGGGREFGIGGHATQVGLFIQVRYLVPRTETKMPLNNDDPAAPHDTSPYHYPFPPDPNVHYNPGYPGWESSGWIYAGGLDISLKL